MALPDPSITATLATEDDCVAYLEQLRWPNGIACPTCGNQKISRFQAKGKSGKVRQICQCLDRDCKYQFSATTGTIFHDSHLALSKWFEAMRLHSDRAAPIPVNQLRFALDVQYKTAKNVADRIQQASAAGTIELDSTARIAEPERRKAAAPISIERPRKLRETAKPKRKTASRGPAIASTPRPRVSHPSAMVARKGEPPTVVDSMLSVFTSAINLGVKPPLAAVKYLKKKILD